MSGHPPQSSFASQPVVSILSPQRPSTRIDDARGGAGTRIDDGHQVHADRRGSQRPPARPPRPAAAPATEGSANQPEPSQLEDLLRLHAADLIGQLQQAAESLDAREARLHAQIAMHERRERAFRLWSESQRSEMEELRDEAERLRAELKTAARRVVLTDTSPLQG